MPRTWLITGSSRGLGRALAEAALAAGENVVATARNPDQVQDLVKRYPSSARAVRLDVTDRAQAAAAVEATTDAFGRLDVLVNNAGYANVNSIEDFAEDDFRAQIETDLRGSSTSPGRPCPSFASSLAATSCRSPRSAAATRSRELAPIRQPSGPSRASPECSKRSSLRSGST